MRFIREIHHIKKSDLAWTTVKSAHGVDLEITKLKNECCLNEL